MASLFISYSRKDLEVARQLTEAFKGQDLDFWIDWEGIAPTVDWWKEIEKGIEQADNFLFLLSPDSAGSGICRKEIEHAAKNGKRLIPIVVRDIQAPESPAELSHLNWIFLRDTDNFHASFSKLITAIKTDYEWVQSHRRLQVKALEWERSGRENSLLLRGKDLQEAELQLATNTSKEPHPTDVQREYVLRSRQAADRQRTVVTGIAIAGVIALAALAIFGFVQAGLATANAEKEQAASTLAVSNANTAQVASTLAISNAETAVANEAEAKRQANIALARQLAAQAQSIWETGDSRQELAVLLAVQSMQIFPVIDSAQILQNTILAHPVARMTHDDIVSSVAFSPDGEYVVSGSGDGTARVWEASTGREIARMTHDDIVSSVAFSPDGKYAVSGSDDGTALVWEASTGREIVRMTHDDIVSSVAFSPDGKYVISASNDDTARVWEASTGREIARMTHDDIVSSVAFGPDGEYVVSGSNDGTARVWEASTGREIARMTHDDIVSSVAFSPDGNYAVSGGCEQIDLAGYCRQGTARVWQASSGNEVARMAHAAHVSSLAFSPDSRYVISGSDDGTARVWEASTGKEIARIFHDIVDSIAFELDGTYAVSSVVFSPDGQYVVSGSDDGTARLWEASTGREIARMTHDNAVWSVAFSPDGRYVVSGSSDHTTRVWEIATGTEIAHMAHDGLVFSVAFSPDGRYVVSGSGDETVRVWEASTGKEIARMAHGGRVFSVAFSPDGKYVVSNGDGLAVRVWEASSGEEIAQMIHDRLVSSVAFSPDGKYVVSGDYEGVVRVWEAASGKEIAHMIHDSGVSSVAFSLDGKYVVSAGGNTARVWEASNGEEVARMTHARAVDSVAFSPDGGYVVSAGCDEFDSNFQCKTGTDRVWEAATGKEVARMTHDGVVRSAAFSPNGKYVVSAGCDEPDSDFQCKKGTARVWEAATGKEVTRMTHDGWVNSAAFSPDGKYVVSSGGLDRTARVWEAATGKEVARMTHDDKVDSVAFSPDGKYVVSGSWDGTVRVWLYRPEDLIADACSRVTRNLTRTQWKQYIGDTLPYPAKQEDAICPNMPIEPEPTPVPSASFLTNRLGK